MRIRQVLAWDYFHEGDNASPTAKFTNITVFGAAVFALVSRKLNCLRGAPGESAAAFLTAGLTQSETLRYHVKITLNAVDVGFSCGLIFQGDAPAGQFLGNSRVLALDAANTVLYPSAADILGAPISSTVHAHSPGNTYRIMIEYNPSTGAFEIFEDDNLSDDRPDPTTSLATGTDGAPLTGNGNLGVYCDNCDCDFEFFQVQTPDSDNIVHGSVSYHKTVSKRPMTFAFAVGIDDDLTMTRDFRRGDFIEIVIEDGTVAYRECFGRINWEEWDTTHGTCKYSGRDPLEQLVVQEGNYNSGGAQDNQVKIQGLLSGHSDDLPGIDVKAGGNAYENVYFGRSAWDVISSFARQAGYGLWYSKDRKVMVTDVYAASGITIDTDTDPVVHVSIIEDLYDLCNSNRMYSQGNVQSQSDAGSRALYGNRGGLMHGGVGIDQHITADAQAAEEGQFFIDNFKDPVQAVSIQVADFHELDVGQTLTLNIDQLGLNGVSALCVEKHYIDGSPWLTFHCVIYAVNPLLRTNRDPALTVSEGKQGAHRSNAWQSTP